MVARGFLEVADLCCLRKNLKSDFNQISFGYFSPWENWFKDCSIDSNFVDQIAKGDYSIDRKANFDSLFDRN